MSNQPFSLIEEETFMKLRLYGRVSPPEIPTSRTIRDQVMKLYDVERSKLIEKMRVTEFSGIREYFFSWKIICHFLCRISPVKFL